jgi:hypothetical protein
MPHALYSGQNHHALFRVPDDHGVPPAFLSGHYGAGQSVELVFGHIGPRPVSVQLEPFQASLQPGQIFLTGDGPDVLGGAGVSLKDSKANGFELVLQSHAPNGELAHGTQGDGEEFDFHLPKLQVTETKMRLPSAGTFILQATSSLWERQGGIDGHSLDPIPDCPEDFFIGIKDRDFGPISLE